MTILQHANMNCLVLKHCTVVQLVRDPGILELKFVQLGTDTKRLRAMSVENLFGAKNTKLFEPIVAKNQLLDAWVQRAHYGGMLPCAGQNASCVSDNDRCENGKHVLWEGEQLKLSLHYSQRFDDIRASGKAADSFALNLDYSAKLWNDRIWAMDTGGLCPSSTSEEANSTICLLIDLAGFVTSSSLGFEKVRQSRPTAAVHNTGPETVISLDHIHPSLIKQLHKDGVFQAVSPKLKKLGTPAVFQDTDVNKFVEIKNDKIMVDDEQRPSHLEDVKGLDISGTIVEVDPNVTGKVILGSGKEFRNPEALSSCGCECSFNRFKTSAGNQAIAQSNGPFW